MFLWSRIITFLSDHWIDHLKFEGPKCWEMHFPVFRFKIQYASLRACQQYAEATIVKARGGHLNWLFIVFACRFLTVTMIA